MERLTSIATPMAAGEPPPVCVAVTEWPASLTLSGTDESLLLPGAITTAVMSG